MAEGFTLTMLFAVGDQKLQHLVHCPHEEDDPQLGHPHSNQTPQEDGREHGTAERDGICESRRSVSLTLRQPFKV